MLKLFTIVIFTALLVSCGKQGDTQLLMEDKITSSNLPEDLKGLKVYKVFTGFDDCIKVAVINNKVSSVTYHEGKTEQSILVLAKEESEERFYMIPIEEIIIENDTMIMARKKPKNNKE